MPNKKKRIRRAEGNVFAIPLSKRTFGYGRVLPDPLLAFYDLRSNELLPVETVISANIAFTLFAMDYPIGQGDWPVIGKAPLSAELLVEPLFFKRDPISGRLTIYRDSTGEEKRATKDECERLERAAVWEPEHIIDRLEDHFAGRPNKWVESLRP